MKILMWAALGLTLTATGAQAHGAATWIMNSPATTHCCGPTECGMEMTNDVVADGNGWLVKSTGQHFSEKAPDVYPSIDEHYWTCRMPPNRISAEGGRSQRQVRCLFVPAQI